MLGRRAPSRLVEFENDPQPSDRLHTILHGVWLEGVPPDQHGLWLPEGEGLQ